MAQPVVVCRMNFGWHWPAWIPVLPAVGQQTGVVQNHDYYAYPDAQGARDQEYEMMKDAASIGTKLSIAVDSVRLPAGWKYLSYPEGAYFHEKSNTYNKERPVPASLDFRRVHEIFAYFEAIFFPRWETLWYNMPQNMRGHIFNEINNCVKVLSNMIKTAILKDEPTIFFDVNWPSILLVSEKLAQARLSCFEIYCIPPFNHFFLSIKNVFLGIKNVIIKNVLESSTRTNCTQQSTLSWRNFHGSRLSVISCFRIMVTRHRAT